MRRISQAITAATLAAVLPAAVPDAAAQQADVVAHTVDMSSRQATLGLELDNGGQLSIGLSGGTLRINGTVAGEYRDRALEDAWRNLLNEAASLPTPDLKARLSRWAVPGLAGPDAAVKAQIDRALRELPTMTPGAPLAIPAPPGVPGQPVPPGMSEAEIEAMAERAAERVMRGEQVAERVRQAMERRARQLESGGFEFQFDQAPSRGMGGVAATAFGLLGVFVALAAIGFGLVSFAPRQLEAVADTVHLSFFRSFMAGLFAQPLLLPVLGMLIVGLVLTVVGIIVLPVAIAAFVVAVVLGLVGGYLAVARVLGESLFRRVGRRDLAGAGSYRSLLVGLAALLMIWAPFTLLGWIPVAGWILLAAALAFTWIMATAGFGAAILSRGGVRATFARPEDYSLTGEVDAIRALKELER